MFMLRGLFGETMPLDHEDEVSASTSQLNTRPPQQLSLKGNKAQNWKRFKKRWGNFLLLSGLEKRSRGAQVIQLENCLDDTLEILKRFSFTSDEANRTVKEIIEAFEEFCIGKIHETFKR